MTLSADEVRYVASLARLALDDDEIERLAPQLSAILEYAEQVGEIVAEEVPPTAHPYALQNVQREDTPRTSVDRADLLAAAPEVDEERFVVPRIVSEEA